MTQKLTPTYVLQLCLIILFSFLPGEGGEITMQKEAREQVTRIYFIPFAIETYVPVTMSDIEDKSVYTVWFIKDHPFITKLHKLLQSKPASEELDGRVIRLQVEFAREKFYVDQDGRVLEANTGRKFQLSKKQLGEIENGIVYFSGVIDIRASKNVTLPR